MRAEISYDLVMEDDMDFVEGTFRLPRGKWQVVIVSKGAVASPEVKPTTWGGSMTGLIVTFPASLKLSRAAVEDVLGRSLGVNQWEEVRGPDSMQLR